MKTIFIADAHLRHRNDIGYDRLIQFLDSMKGQADHLYILGDFFDFWFSDDGLVYPDFQDIIAKLVEVKTSGVFIHLLEGNHDFALRKYFSDQLGMEVIPDWTTVTLEGKRLYLAHGDLVDAEDASYLFFRKILRSKTFGWFKERLPSTFWWKVARGSSTASKKWLGETRERLARKMYAFSLRKFEDGFDAVILGHCHEPLLRKVEVDGRERVFVTMGDWIDHFSYLVLEEGQFNLLFYRIPI
jgi:UDP-2,3-diacylglucosamine hydrolase